MMISVRSWEKQTLNPGLLYLMGIGFLSGLLEGWPALQPCGVLDNSVLDAIEAAPCKQQGSLQKASKPAVFCITLPLSGIPLLLPPSGGRHPKWMRVCV